MSPHWLLAGAPSPRIPLATHVDINTTVKKTGFCYSRGGVNIPPPHHCRLARLTDREVADPCVTVVSVFPPPLSSSP